MAKIPYSLTVPNSIIIPAVPASPLKGNTATCSGYHTYLLEFLGKEPTPVELVDFIHNQDLLLITRRKPENDVYHISLKNDTGFKLLSDGRLQGGAIQLHSQQVGHLFYSVLFEGQGREQGHYLMLDAMVETACINGFAVQLVQGIALITVEELILGYSPISCSLN